jgi:polyphosphate kinase
MQPKINYNDAWESIPLAVVDDVIDFFNRELQPIHPLRAFRLFPVTKCCRRFKYLVEEEESSDVLWVLDQDLKKRIRGKTCFYFKRIETQKELDAMLVRPRR